jgi:hypothetical protein
VRSNSQPSLIQQWRAADAQAFAAERALLEATIQAGYDLRHEPSPADWENARRLRAEATRLFRRAMEEVASVNERATRIVQGVPQRATSAE